MFVYCNPCGPQYHGEKDDKGYVFDQHYGLRPLKIYQKGESLRDDDLSDTDSDDQNQLISKEEKLKIDIRTEMMKMFLDGEQLGQTFTFSDNLNSFMDTLTDAIYDDVKANAPKDLQTIAVAQVFEHVTTYVVRNLIKVAIADKKERFQDDDEQPWEQILGYCKMVKPDYAPGFSDEFDDIQMSILKYILLAAFVCPNMSKDEENQLKVFKDPYYRNVCKSLPKFTLGQWRYFTDPQQVIMHAELTYLRMVSYQDYNASMLVRQFNYLTTLFQVREEQLKTMEEEELEFYYRSKSYSKDRNNFKECRHILEQMIKYYHYVNKKDEEDLVDHKITIFDENELVAMAQVDDKDLFRKVLEVLFIDIEDNKFKPDEDYSHKLRCLAFILLNVGKKHMKPGVDDGNSFIIPEDINMCCNLVRIQLDKLEAATMYQPYGANQTHKTLDCLCDILNIMAKYMLKGLSQQSYEHLKATLGRFMDDFTGRVIGVVKRDIKNKATGLTAYYKYLSEATSLDEQEEMTHKLGFSCQAMFAMQAVNRIKEAFMSDYAKDMELLSDGYGGAYSLIDGLHDFDMDKIKEGSIELGKVSLVMYDKSPKNWYDGVNLMFNMAEHDFEEFGKVFFDGDSERKIIKEFQATDSEGQVLYTYFTVKCLDRIIRNRTKSFQVRMQAITYMRYVYENKNYENKKKLHFIIFPSMMFFVKERLLDLVKMKNFIEDNLMSKSRVLEMTNYAEDVLYSIHEDTKDADKYVRKMIQELAPDQLGTNQRFDFYDFSLEQGENRILRQTLTKKLQFQDLITSIYQQSMENYKRLIKDIDIVPIYGKKYVDGKQVCNLTDEEIEKLSIQAMGESRKTFQVINNKRQHETVEILDEALPNFIDELDQRILLLSANSGGGKSVLLRQLENWAWNRYLAGESNYIPIFISYDQLENDGKIVQQFIDSFNQEQFTLDLLLKGNKFQEIKYLVILDDFNNSASVQSIFQQNDFDSWDPDTKFIFSTNIGLIQEYRDLYQTKQEPLLEYKVVDLKMHQVEIFIKKTITRNKIAIHSGKLKEEKVKQLKDFLEIKQYIEMIEELNLLNIMRNTWMMNVVIKSLPNLKCSRLHDQYDSKRRTMMQNYVNIYKTFSNKEFTTNAERMIDSAAKIPHGYKLRKSFKNYTCSFAMDMWSRDMKIVNTQIENSSFPEPQVHLNKMDENVDEFFLKYFEDDARINLAREGATQISTMDGKATFVDSSIRNYHVAYVLFKYLQDYETNVLNGTPIEKSYFTANLIAKDGNDIVGFIVGMILNAREKHDKYINDSPEAVEEDEKICLVERNIVSILHKINKDNLHETYNTNILVIVMNLLQLVKEIPNDVILYLLNEDKEGLSQLERFRKKLYWGLALDARDNNDFKKKDEYELKALEYELGGVYEGELALDGSDYSKILKKAEGQGEIKYHSKASYRGQFKDNQKDGRGTYKFSKQSQKNEEDSKKRKLYAGEFCQDVIHGEGKLGYACGDEYTGMFNNGLRNGIGSLQYTASKSEYHGGWYNDQKNGKGLFISRQKGNEFVFDGHFKHDQFSGPASITFGQENEKYSNMVFEGSFAHGVCQEGYLKVSRTKKFKGTMDLKKDSKFRFLFDSEGIPEYLRTIVYYQVSLGGPVTRRDFAEKSEATKFYKRLENIIPDEVSLQAKAIVNQGKVLGTSGFGPGDPDLQDVYHQAAKDKVLKRSSGDPVLYAAFMKQASDKHNQLVSEFTKDLYSRKLQESQALILTE